MPSIHWNSVWEGGHVVVMPFYDWKSEHYFLGLQLGLLQQTVSGDTYPYSGNEGVTTLMAYHATVLIARDKSQTASLIYKEHHRDDYKDDFNKSWLDSEHTELAKYATRVVKFIQKQ